MCAVYAFMRRADDITDDESKTIEARRAEMTSWLHSWRASRKSPTKTENAGDPVFIALGDTQQRFAIPDALLEELVAGTSMDLEPHSHMEESQPQTYATFDDLYRYCYLVASVVGLVCIRIFGYSDPRAEKLAEETGIAFQLTNILRDVAEDAERNRIYLPLEDLAAHNVSVDQLLHHAKSRPTAEERQLLKSIAGRAESYYQSAQQLLPLIDAESRPALKVLVSIYHQLLKRIDQANYDVFSERASVPTVQKLAILSAGLTRMGLMRLFKSLSLK